ncbi:MAG: hypothetical protein AMJ55_00370 [Gammaproteobacteria bacterium SG8_15]|nr:MAG: hypothetical protein AMJ55_00370 [Gammaproteobacteria bacterium SG8_15]
MGDIFKTKQETQTTIPGAGRQESAVLNMLLGAGQGAAGILDPTILGQLASGQLLAPTGQDISLLEQATGASREIAERAAREQLEDIMRQVEAGALERGIEGSSIEAVTRAIGGREMARQLADINAQQQQQMAEGMLNLPFQRANVQLGANQALLQQLVGTTTPVLQTRLSERLSQPTSIATTTPGLGELVGQFTQGAGQTFGAGLGG